MAQLRGHSTHTDSTPPARSNIIARIALKDILDFHNALESQMREMLIDTQIGMPLENELFEKMLVARERYLAVMMGFKENAEIAQRNALIAFADAVQDIMVCYNRSRRH